MCCGPTPFSDSCFPTSAWTSCSGRRHPATAIKSEQIAGELAGPPFPAPAVGVTRSSSARSRSQRIARLRARPSPSGPRSLPVQTCRSTRIGFPSGSTATKLAGPVVLSSASACNAMPCAFSWRFPTGRTQAWKTHARGSERMRSFEQRGFGPINAVAFPGGSGRMVGDPKTGSRRSCAQESPDGA